MRGFDRVSPLITTPFLIRTIGLELFGVLAFTKAFCYYFTIFTHYGFPYSATRAISLHREDRAQYSEVFCTVQCLKIFALIISSIVLTICTKTIPFCMSISYSLWLYFPIIASATLFPTWLFQGMEKMGVMTALNLSAKLSFLIWLFAAVSGPEHYTTYLSTLAGFELIRLSLALIIAQIKWKIIWQRPKWESFLCQLRSGLHLFLSNLSINSYSRLPTVFLGLFAGPNAAGIYALGIRITRSLLGLIEPLIQAYFPLASRNIYANRERGIVGTLKFLRNCIIIYSLIGTTLFLGSSQLSFWITGEVIPTVTRIMQIMAFLPLIAVTSNILGVELLVNLDHPKLYSRVMLSTGLLCALAQLLFVPPFGAIGAALGVLLCELFATGAMAVGFKQVRSVESAAGAALRKS